MANFFKQWDKRWFYAVIFAFLGAFAGVTIDTPLSDRIPGGNVTCIVALGLCVAAVVYLLISLNNDQGGPKS